MALLAAALLALAAAPPAATAIDDRDPGSARLIPVGGAPAVGPSSSPDAGRLRAELRPGGKLDLSRLPLPAARDPFWEDEGPYPDGPPSRRLNLGSLAPPDWLHLYGTLEGSGAAVEIGAAGLDLPEWHGLSGIWQIDLDTRLRFALGLDEPLAAGLGTEYGLSLPLTARYGPLSLETEFLGATWQSDQALDLRWPPDTVRLTLRPASPVPLLAGLSDRFRLSAEAGRTIGVVPEPLAVRGQLAWEPWRDEARDWFRPQVELNLRVGAATVWEPDLGLRTRLALGRRLTPGRHLQIALEYTHQNLLYGLRPDEGLPNQVAGIRLSY